ncbi:putative Fe-S oxidoreductase [Thioflavicoccus mobilis 8321]|uniref:Putative Fe-S oxidoreductase n=1 Tax=Thioflavicoccus mobilis 8321 TaxID=765912 RepID=L0GSG5_9GAMM|nr:arsenosugar biosynthesis radical SAM (seleno)protein ArsS [Thioflavicoccus mobilis]AGA89698.1 putative Fe-S oxidoreductase [Thioflavicoccus mobilis 8321]
MHETLSRLLETDFPAMRRGRVKTLQVNLGYRCNLACRHCHVAASPKRTEAMDGATVDRVIELLRRGRIETLDLTGGAPELNPHFCRLVEQARTRQVHVIDRCNLTILEEPGQSDLAGFLADQRVEILASLPCYLEENVDAQRGKGVFEASIAALRRLNRLGYGDPGGALLLNLIYNPQGAQLPPPQAELEQSYKQVLADRYGLRFNRLYTIANMPIQRFGSQLIGAGQFDDYMRLLKSAHCGENLGRVMCRELISIDWRGVVYDCDFNQMLDLPMVKGAEARPLRIDDLDLDRLRGRAIRVADHCYGCTAGQGSSCGGALTG